MRITKQITALSALLPLALILASCGREKVDLNEYLTVDVSGYNTIGTASYDIDYEKMITDFPKAFETDKGSELETLGALIDIEDNFNGELDQDSDLKNGDEITFKWDADGIAALEESYKVRFNTDEKKIKVDSLEEPEKFNPFDYLKIVFDGIAPNGRAMLNTESDLPVRSIQFTADRTDGLSNGDKIKVTFGDEDCEKYCFSQGFIPEKTEEEFTVEGLAAYVQNIADIPKDAMDKMDTHAQEVLQAHVADKWVHAESFYGMELLGNYLLTPKDPSIRTSSNNILYFIYKVTAKDPTKEDDPEAKFDYYYYSSYPNIMLLEDGTCSFDLGSMSKPDGSGFFGEAYGEAFIMDKYYYQGYKDLDSMFNKLVTAQIDSYKYENTVK